jgi:NTP pyrophosphatase (non-canonical NTP hydrolase)
LICPYQQTIERFGPRAQMLKLREECLELAEAITKMDEEGVGNLHCNLAHVFDESGDVLNVLRSLMTMTPSIEECAATKMLRTQIRIKTGYYDG